MIRRYLLVRGENLLNERGSGDESWDDILQSLFEEGLNDEEIATLLRQRECWTEEAWDMKAEGYPYDEIFFHLTNLRASCADVARAFMAVGVAPADMLRAVLPFTEGEEDWSVVQVALEDMQMRQVLGKFEAPRPRGASRSV